MMKEKRAHRRKLMHENAFVKEEAASQWSPVVLMDISMQGVKFATATSLVEGRISLIRFYLPGSDYEHHVSIRAVHTSDEGVPIGYRVGARFLDMQKVTALAIAHFLDEVLAS